MNNPRWGFSNVVVLDNGKALITGGHDQNVNDYASTELYDPATGQWTFTGNLNTARRHTVVIGLNNGKVLAATGALGAPDGNRFLNSAELYDPATGSWSPTGSAPVRRESADGVLLRDGRVMVVGGYTCCDSFPPETDLYDPSTGTWSRAGDRPHGGGGMALVSLPDGRVLSVGGGYGNNGGPNESAEAALFDPSTGQWTATASPHFARSGANAIVLPDGKVLIAGGGPAESELFDPATNTWSVGPALNVPRGNGHMTVLDTGDVLMAAGYNTTGPITVTELYNDAPTTDRFTYPIDLSQRTGLIGYDVHPSLGDQSKCFGGKNFKDLWHAGEDWFASPETPVQAVGAGTVVYVSPPGYDYPGAVVVVEHAITVGGSIWSMYGHLNASKVMVGVGSVVNQGDTIANGLLPQKYKGADNTHLHWEMRYFYDGSAINQAPKYKSSCSGVPGPGYTFPDHPDSFVANNGAGPTYSWTAPTAFVETH
ncbi:MAG TPA: peptidoglycan DD-metalloendopeptidase family protein [Pseudonocardiaceae bacterium]|nr:peptidoglycan DD-metalloendopeptidase family protein [Pseudonocardiaceae bacterium]